jgi:hypothetical protein
VRADVCELLWWSPGRPRTPGADRVVADPGAPLARHGLVGLAVAYAAATGAPLHPVHREVAGHLAMRSLAADGALGEVTDALGRAGIPAFVAKGPAVAHRLYPDARLRLYADLDVYVAGPLAEARAALAPLGYRPVAQRPGPLGGQARELHGGRFGAVVEVHDSVVDNLQRHRLPPLSAYLDHVEEAVICGVRVPVLAPAAHLALVAVHLGAGHRYARLICHRDVAALAWAFDPAVVADLGATPFVAAAFELARLLGATGVPRPAAGRRRAALVRAMARRDPATWDEYAASRANLWALVHDLGARGVGVAAVGALRAAAPVRGRRVGLRLAAPAGRWAR